MRPRRRVEPIEWLSLAAALTPIVVAVARSAVTGWVPIGDAAYFTLRSRDVFTSHWPLLGAWSSGSSVMETPVNNLGPLQLYLLAPFTKLSAHLGTAIGSAVINAVAVWLVWWAARRMFGPLRVALVMAGTLLLMATLGLSWLIDARQQFALVLPFFALLWLTAAMWAGDGSAVPTAVVVASVVAQTHFTYVYPAVGLTAIGVVVYLLRTLPSDQPRALRTLSVGTAVLVVCWVPSLVDQLFGSGNLLDVGRQAGGGEGRLSPGWGTGAEVFAGASLVPPFWLPGSMGDFLMPRAGVSRAGAIAAIAGWGAAAAIIAATARRLGRTESAAVAGAVLATVVAGLVTASYIPISRFGLMPQNYYWAWAAGAFAMIGLATAAAHLVRHGLQPRSVERPVLPRQHSLARWAAVVPILAVLAVATWPRYPLESVAYDEREAQRVGVPLVEQMRSAFAVGSFPETVEVDLSEAFFGNNYMWVMLVELQRAGVEFTFPPGSLNLRRFGQTRCEEVGDAPQVLLFSGANPTVRAGDLILVRVEGVADAELTEREELDEYFAGNLRSGEVVVDTAAVRSLLGADTAEVEAVLADPDRSADGLAMWLEIWASYGLVEMSDDDWRLFRRWRELEKRSFVDFQTIVLRSSQDQVPTDDPVIDDRSIDDPATSC